MQKESKLLFIQHQISKLTKDLSQYIQTPTKKHTSSEEKTYIQASLSTIVNILNDPKQADAVRNAITKKRFDKKLFPSLKHTVLLGQNGGVYMLINTVGDTEYKLLSQHADIHFLEENKPRDTSTPLQKLSLGKGSFSKVRFAICLFPPLQLIKNPPSILSVKKTNDFAGKTPVSTILKELEEDYSGKIIKAYVKTPHIYDRVLVNNGYKDTHSKGYLFLELVAQKNAQKFFLNPINQRWIYQKEYLINLVKEMIILQKKYIFLPDIKPANTLYKPNEPLSMIDLGGMIHTSSSGYRAYAIQSWFPFSPHFSSPEIQKGVLNLDLNLTVDLDKAGRYNFGCILRSVITKSDILPHKKSGLDTLISGLTHQDPNQRISLYQAQAELEAI